MTEKIQPTVYVAKISVGKCQICGIITDLRSGACFKCSDFVDGKRVGDYHILWDCRYPNNKIWRCYDPIRRQG